MIVSASRRTDIPAHYADWFVSRLAEGGTVARNPFNPMQERFVSLTPEAVDGFVFWSKNPAPMLGRLALLQGYAYYFQFTLNAYGEEIEPGLPPFSARIDTFRRLSEALGANRVVWRYDPIFTSVGYTADWHAETFVALAESLRGYTRRVTISFLDYYQNISKNIKLHGINVPETDDIINMASKMAPAAAAAGMSIDSCAEADDLSGFGITRGKCVDAGLLSEIAATAGRRVDNPETGTHKFTEAGKTQKTRKPVTSARPRKDPNQRPACGCAPSVDIGTYNTCKSGCVYCYAAKR
jgi:hypothetical protein